MQRRILSLLILGFVLLGAGCASQQRTSTTDTAAPTQTVTSQSAAQQTPTTAPSQSVAALTVGVDADGYHTLGDPAAPVTLTDYSDYF
jgi:protein-disulfide isomerase